MNSNLNALLLTGGLTLVGGFTLLPTLWPRTHVPTMTHTPLPTVQATPDGSPPSYPSTTQVKPIISGKLNINTASQEQLELLPKVGPSLAKRIIQGRPYRNLNDLDRVKGIGASTLNTLAPLVTY